MIPPQWMRLVSILVLVEVLPWDEAYDRKNRALPLFQSLFWWKYCPGMPQILLKLIMIICFNPCSGGSIAPGGPDRLHSLHVTRCFNPCSGGSIALGRLLFA